ncbi:MAG: hypothetical protein HY397_01165 [Candidatus Doudnabacteria bacterium]|nr:hypothetical protein [Candidatus Doudnabacteria bacterium]
MVHPEVSHNQPEPHSEVTVAERARRIQQATSFEELYEILNSTAGTPFQGSEKAHNPTDQVGIIKLVRLRAIPASEVTRAEGLRKKVRELRKAELERNSGES